MIRIYYELGPEDDNAIISVQSLDVLSDIGSASGARRLLDR